MKDKLIEYITFIETALVEINERKEAFAAMCKELREVTTVEEKKNLAVKAFTEEQYIIMLSTDFVNTMIRVGECYQTCVLLKVDLGLSETEIKILDNYVVQTNGMFRMEKGKITAKQEGLYELMLIRAETLRETPFIIESYINKIENEK